MFSQIKQLGLVAIAMVLVVQPVLSEGIYDALELPSPETNRANQSRHYSIEKFSHEGAVKTYNGRSYIAGERGIILFSDDNGVTWTQAKVPVRVDLLDIYFPTKSDGWAVGHRGVVLHSSDGGETWEKQFDGLRYGTEGLAIYEKMLATEPDGEKYDILVGEMEFAIRQGSDKPLFKVYFADDQLGYAFGAYGMFIRTDDGGKNWYPILQFIDNEMFFHIFDYANYGERDVLVVGEAGVVFKATILSGETERLDVPYEGSFFTTVIPADGSFIIGGLRGTVLRSTDLGGTWFAVEKPETNSIIDSIELVDGRVLLLAQSGHILVSSDSGQSFSQSGKRAVGATGFTEGSKGELIIVGAKGVSTLKIGS